MKNKILNTIFFLLVVVMITSCGGGNAIKIVKNGALKLNPDRTIESVLNDYQYITDGKWSMKKTESGKIYVYFKASISDVGLYGEDYMQKMQEKYGEYNSEIKLGRIALARNHHDQVPKEIEDVYMDGLIMIADTASKLINKDRYNEYLDCKENPGKYAYFKEEMEGLNYPKWAFEYLRSSNYFPEFAQAIRENKTFEEIKPLAEAVLKNTEKYKLDMNTVSDNQLLLKFDVNVKAKTFNIVFCKSIVFPKLEGIDEPIKIVEADDTPLTPENLYDIYKNSPLNYMNLYVNNHREVY